ncbi:MAG: hypothetical protein Q9187_004800, partial [Circinaria calcarea]
PSSVNGTQDVIGTMLEPATMIVAGVHRLLVQDIMEDIGIEIAKDIDLQAIIVEAGVEALRETGHPTTVAHQAER